MLKIKHTDKTLENITDKYQKELEEIQNSKKQIIAEAKREAEEILSQANKKIEATIKAIKVAQAEKERTKLARKELEEFNKTLQNESESVSDKKIADKMQQLIERKKRKEERKRREQQRLAGASGQENGEAVTGNENIPDSGALKVGDKVKVKGNDLIGEVLQVGKNSITISVGNITSKISPEQLERISNKEFNTALSKQPKPMSNIHSQDFSQKRLNFKPSIDIRGERLVDALDIVARFIDDALMVGMDQVKILHGKGNGILKEEIRQYLKTVPGVTSCRDEDIRFGGSGITIVELD